MEARAQYGPPRERPRLVVVKDGGASYSALPHEIMRNTALSRDARLLYAILQSHWWQGGECWASHATLAAEMGCTDRHLRRFLRELLAAGVISERRHGHGQAKAYAPVETESQQDGSVRLNGTESSALEPNRTDLSTQQDRSVRPNRTDLSFPYKKTPEKKNPPEDETKDIPAESPERVLFDYYRQKIQPAARINAPEKIRTRLKRFTVDELKAGIDHFASDHWWMDNNATRGAAWFFDSDKRSEQFLNLKPRPEAERSGSAGSSNHAAPASAAPAGTSSSKWDGWKGRHGMTVSRAAGYEDDR